MKTVSFSSDSVPRQWFVVDAADQVLGRLASNVAFRLRGKHKPRYTPHADIGDYIIVINAAKIKVTGNKFNDKIYYRHSGYPGGIKEMNFKTALAKDPTRVIKMAVKGMLPKNSLGRTIITKLKVYSGPEHGHQAQQPKPLDFTPIKHKQPTDKQ